MKNGKFTPEERNRLMSLDAVDEVRAKSIVYSKQFKEECMARYRVGESPFKEPIAEMICATFFLRCM